MKNALAFGLVGLMGSTLCGAAFAQSSFSDTSVTVVARQISEPQGSRPLSGFVEVFMPVAASTSQVVTVGLPVPVGANIAGFTAEARNVTGNGKNLRYSLSGNTLTIASNTLVTTSIVTSDTVRITPVYSY